AIRSSACSKWRTWSSRGTTGRSGSWTASRSGTRTSRSRSTSTDVSERVGFVGLGSMGGAIALRLTRAVPLAVYAARPEAAAPLVAAGAEAVSIEDLGRTCEIVCCCLPTSEDVEQLVGEAGLAAAMQSGAVLIDMTTGSPKVDERIRALLAAREI